MPNDGWTCRNVIIFGVDVSSFAHIGNKGKDILILGEGPTQGLSGTMYTAVKRYLINFTEHDKKICLSLYYIGANSCLFVSAVESLNLKQKTPKLRQLHNV